MRAICRWILSGCAVCVNLSRSYGGKTKEEGEGGRGGEEKEEEREEEEEKEA